MLSLDLNPAARIIGSRWFASACSHVAHRVDLVTYSRTAGRVHVGVWQPTLLLTTRGCRTGLPRTMPLLYVRDGEAFVVVGSNWGKPDHPGWSANLLADAAATVQVGGQRAKVRAELVEGPERDRLWVRLREVYAPYEAYREWSGRELRMFRLQPDGRTTPKAPHRAGSVPGSSRERNASRPQNPSERPTISFMISLVPP